MQHANRTTSAARPLLAALIVAAGTALACGPAAAQTTRDMGKDTSQGTTSDAKLGAGPAANGVTSPHTSGDQAVKNGTLKGNGALSTQGNGSTAAARTGVDPMGGTGGSSTAHTGPLPKS